MKLVVKRLQRLTKLAILLVVICLIHKVNLVNSNDKVVNENLNKMLDLTAMSVKLNEIQLADKYYPLDTFTGNITGYVADCPLCSGFLGCNGQDVRDKTTKYLDKEYGTVYIVASSKNLPCGSVITFNDRSIAADKVTAIVLDRGVLGNDIDLLVSSREEAISKIGRHKLTYDVLRFGWERKA